MLSVPLVLAALSAGMFGGAHCIGMCGGVASMLTSAGGANRPEPKATATISIQPVSTAPGSKAQRVSTLLHAGRLSTYSLIGGIAGAIGGFGLLLNPFVPMQTGLYILGNLALIWMGLHLIGRAPQFGAVIRLGRRLSGQILWPQRFSLRLQVRRHPFVVGMAWGCLPCGLLYGVLPFALLSGSPWSGAILMLIFGLGALPYLLFAQGISKWVLLRGVPVLLRRSCAALLIGIGLLGLWHLHMPLGTSILCITEVR